MVIHRKLEHGHRQDTGHGQTAHWDMVIERTLDMVIEWTQGHGHKLDTGKWSYTGHTDMVIYRTHGHSHRRDTGTWS
jgi:hypothetical protein